MVRTDRAGTYAFTDLDPAETGSSENQYKVEVVDDLGREDGQYHRMSRWYGDAQSYGAAKAAPSRPPGST